MENTEQEKGSHEQNPEEVSHVTETEHAKRSKKGDGIGPVVGIVIIIILLALGGYYYFTAGIEKIPSYNDETADATVTALAEQSGSDAIADIEADINATDLSEIDLLLQDLDADLSEI